MRHCIRIGVAALAVIVSQPVLAHTGRGTVVAFHDGWLHPILGTDHLLAAIAVGLWAALIGGRSRLLLPLAFVGAMTVGAIAALGGLALPSGEALIVGSLIGLGLALALNARPAVALGMLATSLFAIAHGTAHGAEAAPGASGLHYLLGLVGATAALHGAGLAIGTHLREHLLLQRLAGGALIAAGVALAAIG